MRKGVLNLIWLSASLVLVSSVLGMDPGQKVGPQIDPRTSTISKSNTACSAPNMVTAPMAYSTWNRRLTDFSPPPDGLFHPDHDQRDTLSTGFDVQLPWHSWASGNIAYGSGFLNGDGPEQRLRSLFPMSWIG